MKKLASIIVKIIGWKIDIKTPIYDKSLFVVAPHTSNLDFLVGYFCYCSLGYKSHFIIKKSWFNFPVIGYLLKKAGGIGVDRKKAKGFTNEIIKEFHSRDVFHVAITPEGTRKRVKKWKKGFYLIAEGAKVPIILIKMDYKYKLITFFEVFTPTGDINADMKCIQEKFKGVTARHPENFSTGE